MSSLYALAMLAGFAAAQVFPYTPTQTLRVGKTYEISWKPEAGWENTTISLMSGDNESIDWSNALENITEIDASKKKSYDWKVPAVAPCAPIYFLQFSQPGEKQMWTGRFSVCEGKDKPEAPASVDGEVSWGVGSLLPSATGRPDHNGTDDHNSTHSGNSSESSTSMSGSNSASETVTGNYSASVTSSGNATSSGPSSSVSTGPPMSSTTSTSGFDFISVDFGVTILAVCLAMFPAIPLSA